jgi:predicted nuclease of predicted toxin-antitoxin system
VKLLFDENLSPQLVARLSDLFPSSLHVRTVGMQGANDPLIWTLAEENDYLIVSKDSDMHDLSLLRGAPPKVIWIRLGNCSTRQVEQLLRRELQTIKTFYENEEVSLIALY